MDADTTVEQPSQTTFLTHVVNPLTFIKKEPQETQMFSEPEDESMTEFNFAFENGITIRIMLAPKEMGSR